MKRVLKLKTFRYGEARRRGEGLRIGATRLPPRGVPKGRWHEYFDVWFPLLAPSEKLRKRRISGKLDDDTYRVLYERELSSGAERRQAVELLAALACRTPISIGCYCADEARCHRSHLRRLIERAAEDIQLGSSRAKAPRPQR